VISSNPIPSRPKHLNTQMSQLSFKVRCFCFVGGNVRATASGIGDDEDTVRVRVPIEGRRWRRAKVSELLEIGWWEDGGFG